jgi:peptidoglycan/xylan/chitin deacetylase (PgdA/CDA1 family)
MIDRFVTVSVDDGHSTDLQTAELLSRYGIAATFYVPVKNPEREVLTKQQIRELASRFEIGGHTLNHVALKPLPFERAWAEVHDGKTCMEDIIGQPLISFCYPRGKFDRQSIGLVQKAGFLGARTCLLNLHDFPRNPFLWGVSTHACWHSRMIQVRHALLEGNLAGAGNFFRVYKGVTDWERQFLHALDHIEVHGGIAHLYLHSWEIDANGQWQKLDAVFRSIAGRKNLRFVSNGDLFRLWKSRCARSQQN